MRILRQLLAGASLGLALTACDGATAPITGPTTAGSVTAAGRSGGTTERPQAVTWKPGAPPLATTHTRFWAVQGKESGAVIAYRESAGVPGLSFLEFTVPAQARMVDPTGRPLARGDSIEIEIRVVPGQLAARFSPCGLVFEGKHPAQLAVSYLYGEVPTEAARKLAIWYLPPDDAPWQEEASRLDRRHATVVAQISHFSNYAVAY